MKCTLPAVALLTCVTAIPKFADAASVDIFLIADQTVPASTTSVPFSFTTKSVYQLGSFNNRGNAGSATKVDNFSYGANASLSFSSLNDPSSGPSSGAPNENFLTDQDEVGAGTASYVNSQIASLDNSGISGTTVEADEQVDFGRNSSIIFNPVSGGFTDLILSDLGGLNPFNLSLCGDATCSVVETIFAGLQRSARNALLSTGLFAADDSGAESTQDQTWLFRFASSNNSFIRVTEDDNRNIFTGARLQADFLGAGTGTSTTPTPSPVPGPAGLPLLASGLILLGWQLRRKQR
ncbi:hypothetical protein [uncultured Roseobacter sp.]|uniref:hypothetical protein n=1 Tax=uncultured Roseobacter sp. TaxID=114847 RepID=UPI0026372062|nr:hypothetical protein [uncultured Roseobacter sp.]